MNYQNQDLESQSQQEGSFSIIEIMESHNNPSQESNPDSLLASTTLQSVGTQIFIPLKSLQSGSLVVNILKLILIILIIIFDGYTNISEGYQIYIFLNLIYIATIFFINKKARNYDQINRRQQSQNNQNTINFLEKKFLLSQDQQIELENYCRTKMLVDLFIFGCAVRLLLSRNHDPKYLVQSSIQRIYLISQVSTQLVNLFLFPLIIMMIFLVVCLFLLIYMFLRILEKYFKKVTHNLKRNSYKRMPKKKYSQVQESERAETLCHICLQDYQDQDEIIMLPCSQSHYFHNECIQQWLSTSDNCPLCRKDIYKLISNRN